MRRFFTVLFALIMAVVSGKAQQVLSVERWSGKLNVGVQKLTVGFVINTMSDGTHVCTMDVPEQGAVDIPVVLLKNDADSLKVSIPSIGATYNGHRVSNESIKGLFTQNGYGMVLDLNSGGIELKRPQTPLPPYEYCTEDVVFLNEAEGAELAGTLTYPVGYERMEKGTVPVVLMVTGSGAQDRNEELFGHKPFLVIADFLARNGIASLRYDDRGVGKSKGVVQGTTTMNNLADAAAGISYLRNIGKFGKVGVIGHSEGGTIAFMLGANRS
ncbi:MAG: alpha/beta hydrolase, partial [Bacteroidaceae bacterium]|nr:alpha/beta hydrolase [Bacteroidaceae bacterium]